MDSSHCQVRNLPNQTYARYSGELSPPPKKNLLILARGLSPPESPQQHLWLASLPANRKDGGNNENVITFT